MSEQSHKVVRMYFDDEHPDHHKVIKRGLSLEEAQQHCRREDTHEKDPETGNTVWFDGYEGDAS